MQARHALNGFRVLVAEDEFFLADDMAFAIQMAGADVDGPHPDTRSAVAAAERSDVDLAVLDINLRGQSVFPAADALERRGIPFVFTTGYDASVVPAQWRHIPVWEKPFHPAQVIASLAAIAASSTREKMLLH